MTSKKQDLAKRLGFGVIGYGPWGQNLCRQILNGTRGTVAQVWTRSEGTAAKIRSHGFNATNDVDELISNPAVEVVIVASPNALHKEHALKVCSAGKPLWAEKPLVLNLKDYDEILSAVEKAGILNHCNFGMRFGRAPRTLIEMSAAGTLGKPVHLISRVCRGTGLFSLGSPHKAVLNPDISGGWILHHMCHQVDFSLRVAGEKVVKVYCQTSKSAPECPSEESVAAILTTESGAVLELADGVGPMAEHHLSFMGSKAMCIEVNGDLILRGQCDASEFSHGFGGSSTLLTPEGWGDDSMAVFIAEVTGVPHGRNYQLKLAPLSEGRHVLEVLLAMRQSADTGKIVEL
jgi:myo-inositol 2-dehydrogenase / D-chiro-inositol 1-dehydrogenase